MKELLTYDDVLIVPKFSTIESRKDVDLSSNHEAFPHLKLPIISANMDTITGSQMAKAMIANGGIGCLHRFCSIEENVKMFKDSIFGHFESPQFPMVSIGLGDLELDRAEALVHVGAYNIVVDVANGASLSVVKQVKALKEIFGESIRIIVGNFATGESVKTFLEHSGTIIDSVKVGIGPGSLCSTRTQTGVGIPQLSAVMDVVNVLKNSGIAVIADGGLKKPGDIAKALGIGADLVMIGGMLSGTEESPGEIVKQDVLYSNGMGEVKKFKKYRGSASKESYEAQGKVGTHRTTEGESTLVPYKGSVKDVLQDIEGGLRSSFSYVGARNLKEFHEKVEFIKITSSGYVEGTPHGVKS